MPVGDENSAGCYTFVFPASAAYGKKVTKEKIYQYASPPAGVKQKFIQHIDKITWQYKLAPETINTSAAKHLAEIQVLDIWLKPSVTDIDETLLRVIDKAISMPLYYRVFAGQQLKCCMAYKRPSESDTSQWVVDGYFASPWLEANKVMAEAQALPVALNMQALYEQLLRSLMPEPARVGESLQTQVARISQGRHIAKQLDSLTVQLLREKQFNRQIDINRQINQLKDQLAVLR